MKAVSIFNNKGGVGKTTLLCNIASSLSVHHGKSVLIIDADPQCNATSYVLSNSEIEKIYKPRNPITINNLVDPYKKGKGRLPDELPLKRSPGFRVDIIIGDPRLALAEDFLARDWFEARAGEERGIRSTLFFLDILNRCDHYDYVIFDVGPSLGAINRSVLLASEFFMVPMASDIFSLQALSNIRVALEEWKEDIENGIKRHNRRNEDSEYSNIDFREKAKFIGYVTQQYTAKVVEGVRVPVKAYEAIIRKIPSRVKTNLTAKFSKNVDFNPKIGEVPYLQSMVPLSQIANKPIFLLKSSDGVVGSHFAKVREFDRFVKELSGRFIENIESQE